MKSSIVKSENSKQFLSENRELVFKILFSTFRFLQINQKELVNDYFNYVISSKYNTIFCTEIEKKDLRKLIEYSIENFKNQYKYLSTNFDEINKFNEERRQDMYNSKSN